MDSVCHAGEVKKLTFLHYYGATKSYPLLLKRLTKIIHKWVAELEPI